MFVNGGLNEIRDAAKTAADTVRIGTGTTAPTSADTTLGTQVVSKDASAVDGAVGIAVVSCRLGTADANGSDLTECGVQSSSQLMTHSLHATLEKTSSFEAEYEVTLKAVNK